MGLSWEGPCVQYSMGPENSCCRILYEEGSGHHLVTNRGASRSEIVKVALGM